VVVVEEAAGTTGPVVVAATVAVVVRRDLIITTASAIKISATKPTSKIHQGNEFDEAGAEVVPAVLG
jgi:hypothetical protein